MHEPTHIQPAPLIERSTYAPIQDYGLIGNCRAAALVSRAGSLDWLCLPRFDSPSVFGALLDAHKGGRFIIRPVGPHTCTRRYVGATNVLETEFRTPTGALRLTDCMPVASEDRKDRQLWPDHEVLRIVECTEGEVEVELLCDPRPDYGSTTPRIQRAGFPGWMFNAGCQTLLFLSEIDAQPIGYRPGVYGRTTLKAGERRAVSLAFSASRPAILPVLGEAAADRLAQTLQWWSAWSSRCTYTGPHRDAVMRSALALKLMVYAPSGAIIAAPTTSLPETPGAGRNWDYRFCWLRDASFTIRALLELGYTEEAGSFLSWLLSATRQSWPKLSILYDVFGESRQTERELPLEGYAGSRPVRVGNAAHDQLQLDVYGAVIDAAYRYTRAGGTLDAAASKMLAGIGRTAATIWNEPDEGIWEPRSGRRHHTLSKAMCWVAMDRLQSLSYEGRIQVDRDEFRKIGRHIRAEIESRGFNRPLGSYVAEIGTDRLDASLLLLSLYGYADAGNARMRSTVEAVLNRLSAGPLLYRNADTPGTESPAQGRFSDEGAFGLCGFWAAECLALQGDASLARERFERLLTYASDLGLFAEQTDPRTGAALGNFPQAYTHVGVINAAYTIQAMSRTPKDADRAPRSSRSVPGRAANKAARDTASSNGHAEVIAQPIPGRAEPPANEAVPAPPAEASFTPAPTSDIRHPTSDIPSEERTS